MANLIIDPYRFGPGVVWDEGDQMAVPTDPVSPWPESVPWTTDPVEQSGGARPIYENWKVFNGTTSIWDRDNGLTPSPCCTSTKSLPFGGGFPTVTFSGDRVYCDGGFESASPPITAGTTMVMCYDRASLGFPKVTQIISDTELQLESSVLGGLGVRQMQYADSLYYTEARFAGAGGYVVIQADPIWPNAWQLISGTIEYRDDGGSWYDSTMYASLTLELQNASMWRMSGFLNAYYSEGLKTIGSDPVGLYLPIGLPYFESVEWFHQRVGYRVQRPT